jgi:hypothetical protein
VLGHKVEVLESRAEVKRAAIVQYGINKLQVSVDYEIIFNFNLCTVILMSKVKLIVTRLVKSEIHPLLLNSKVHYPVHKILPLVPILG